MAFGPWAGDDEAWSADSDEWDTWRPSKVESISLAFSPSMHLTVSFSRAETVYVGQALGAVAIAVPSKTYSVSLTETPSAASTVLAQTSDGVTLNANEVPICSVLGLQLSEAVIVDFQPRQGYKWNPDSPTTELWSSAPPKAPDTWTPDSGSSNSWS